MRGAQQERSCETEHEGSLHGDVLRKIAVWSFIKACNRTCAVAPSSCGVIDHVAVVNPAGNLACRVFPLSCALAVKCLASASHQQSIIVSVESTTNLTATLP